MAKFKNEAGEEVEALTQAEVDAKLATEKAALETEHKTTVEEKDTTINNLAKEKTDLEAKIARMELDGVKEDHPNFKVLKDALAKNTSENAALKAEIDNEKKSRAQEVMDNAVKTATGGNEELAAKVKLHLEKTLAALPESTPAERQTKLEAALKLSSDSSTQGMFDGGIGGGGAGSGTYGAGTGGDNVVEFTSRERALGAKLGISAEDYKKFGSRLTNKPRN